MNIFFDTNIVLEFLADRPNAKQVEAAIKLCDDNGWTKSLSIGSIYTIAYMTERILHRKGINKPELTKEQRMIYNSLLESFEIVSLAPSGVAEGANDPSFSDLEDSFQYQSALQAHCDILLTLNIKDFKDADQSDIKITAPPSFLNEFQVAEKEEKEE